MDKQKLLQAVRESICDTFKTGDESGDTLLRANLEKHVMLPDEDPGGWAPSACAVIHNEGLMIGGPTTSLGKWIEASQRLYPLGYFIDHVNEAVSAVYRC